MVLAAFAISLVLHVLGILLYPVFLERAATDPDDPEPPPIHREIPELVLIEPVEPEDVEAPVEEPDVEVPIPEAEPALPEPPPEEPEVEPREVPVEPVPEVEEERRLPAVERLRPRLGESPELWTFSDPEALELSPEERAELRIRVAIEALGDSLTAEEERELAAREWTYTDDEGGTWGLSPGTLHLGDREIPLPFALTPAPGEREGVDRMDQELWEFGTAQPLQNVRDVWRERIEAIRERRDAARADSIENRP